MNADLQMRLKDFVPEVGGNAETVVRIVGYPGNARAVCQVETGRLEPVAELRAHDTLLKVVVELQVYGMCLRLDQLHLVPLALDSEVEIGVLPEFHAEERAVFYNPQLAFVQPVFLFQQLRLRLQSRKQGEENNDAISCRTYHVFS